MPATWISGVGAAHRVAQAADVGQAGPHELDRPAVAAAFWARCCGGRRVADERDDVVAAVVEPLDDGPPDEPGAAGDDDAHGVGRA